MLRSFPTDESGSTWWKKYRYFQSEISDHRKTVEVERKVEKENPKNDNIAFDEQLPEKDCPFAIYIHEYPGADGVTPDQLFSIFWAPWSAKGEEENGLLRLQGCSHEEVW